MDEDEQTVREKLMAACDALGPQQQQDLIHFIWLSAHAPERVARKVQRRLLDELESADTNDRRLATALGEAVAALAEALRETDRRPA
ncbi:MAG: hypothetical protein JXB36_14455 [Gammaproteobacteria bacterium]|nr:hypothetical protein [Gammaproteobacteria bacterium]